ncbi:CcoQ/FixQ family Cbb3-type cytochrome c oxidase assembly chaperone [Chitinophagaceae bacterium LB-8]|uniref:CcoQ/FixQ family Cbb3-type cytochrome c oxidase assembly chaperone n=1 Tax=Paraflavisolibacter caeni TaxID=2982496 RepID=A0A9X2XYW5_9BACT|nr:CcoQ/FixQ family Cbb3-type cytochrome c oxidase assembly chaperone [Paraflavisolibacter caeni]MCU7551936.1 CcoQ/FixQ family Cbb3-type cytochrome c oxidase assembly chaperone [Paraflavisolibacter caeni]
MLKYIKQYASTIQGIDIYPTISLLIFVLFFIAVLYYVKTMDKKKVEEISSLPLDLDINQDQHAQVSSH